MFGRSLIFLLVLACCSTATAQQDSFAVVGIHPGASAQSTSVGKILATLFPFAGRLYAGYGDYGANTGPIAIYGFDPESRVFHKELESNTEAVYIYRAGHGRVYAPAIDRKSYAQPGDYAMRDTNGSWSDHNFVGSSGSTHVYDVGFLGDSEVYMAGSQDVRATVWRSTDAGRSWKIVRTDTAISGKANDFARYYFLGVHNEKVYVQASDYYGSLHPYSEIWNGSNWERGVSLFGTSTYVHASRPMEFAGKLVMASRQFGSPASSQLRVFDGAQGHALTDTWVFDLMMDGEWLYALVDSGYGVINVKRTIDLETWQTIARAPLTARSLAVLNDEVFLGTTDSKILRYTRSLSAITSEVEREVGDGHDAMRVYPNPCGEELRLERSSLSRPASFMIMDVTGRVVQQGFCPGSSTTLHTGRLPPGAYRIIVTSKEGVHSLPFVRH